MADNVLDFDPKTGEALVKKNNGLRRSFRSSGGNKTNSYTFKVEIDGYPVFCNPIPRDVIKGLAGADKAFSAEMKAVQSETKTEAIDADTAEQRSFDALDARTAAYKDVLCSGHEGDGAKIIVAWEFPDDEPGSKLPCNAETIRDLPMDVAVQLITAIQQKQTLGQTDADFLARKR